MNERHPLLDTWDELIRAETPNFLRLYVNPHVVQTCLCLSRYVQETWHAGAVQPEYQTFLANGFDEALSGAIKLARFCAAAAGGPRMGLVINPEGRLGPVASVTLENGDKVDFIPELVVAGKDRPLALPPAQDHFGFVVLFPTDTVPEWNPSGPAPLLILCLSRAALAQCRKEESAPWRSLRPDIVV